VRPGVTEDERLTWNGDRLIFKAHSGPAERLALAAEFLGTCHTHPAGAATGSPSGRSRGE
jgi:hypothetical protein